MGADEDVVAAADIGVEYSPAGRGVDPLRRATLIGLALYLPLAALAGWAIIQLFPDRVSFGLLGHVFSAGDLHHRLRARGLVLALIVPAIFAVELAIVGWPDSSLRRLTVRRTRSSTTDLACFVIWQTPLMTALMAGASLGAALISGAWLHDRLRDATGVSLTLAWMPVPLQVLGYFLIYSLLDYWSHRLDHTPRFWPLHRYHHAADDFCVLSAVRTHPAVFTGVIAATLPAAVFQASPGVIVYMTLFIMTLRYVIHSRIDSDFGWVGRYLLQSPVHHRLHHALDRTRPAGHFSLVPLWDHLFGTWRGDGSQGLAIGVAEPYRQGLWLASDMWRDYREFWKGMMRIGRSPGPRD